MKSTGFRFLMVVGVLTLWGCEPPTDKPDKDITVEKDAGVRNSGYILQGLGISTEYPSVVVVPVRITDASTGEPADDLDRSDFHVLEDGLAITSESFLDVYKRGDISNFFRITLALDVSSSMSDSDIEDMRDIARNIVDNLEPDQFLTIMTFGGSWTEISSTSNSKQELHEAIDDITKGGPSTDLWGTITDIFNNFHPSFGFEQISDGALIVVTDGNDTAGLATSADARTAKGDKDLYVVRVGSEVNETTLTELQDLAGADNVFPIADLLAGFNDNINELMIRLENQRDGIHIVYYATPKRDGTFTVELSIVDNAYSGEGDTVTGSFTAEDFSSVEPEIIISGPTSVSVGEPITLSAKTRWVDPSLIPDYTWSVDDPDQLITLAASGADATITVSENGSGYARVLVTDNSVVEGTDDETGADVFLSGGRELQVYHALSPQNVEVVVGDREAVVSWDEVESANYYTVLVSTTSGGEGTPVGYSNFSFPWGSGRAGSWIRPDEWEESELQEELQNDTIYYFTVVSTSGDVTSAPSAEVAAAPMLVVPEAGIVGVDDGKLVHRWTSDGFDSMRLYVGPDPSFVPPGEGTFLSDTSNFEHTGLTNDTTYYYRLTGVTGGVESLPGPIFSAAPSDLWPGQFADSKLHNCLAKNEIEETPAPPVALDEMSWIYCGGQGIQDLSGIEVMSSLQYIELNDNPLRDLSPLSSLVGVTSLDISNTGTFTLNALSNLTNLNSLAADNNSSLPPLIRKRNIISDLSPLAPSLSSLTIRDNNLSALPALSKFTNLGYLGVSYNSISDITALSTMTSLNGLDAAGNNISDLSSLTNLSLGYASLHNNNITNISALANSYQTLEELHISNNPISNASTLSNFSVLRDLRMNSTDLTVLPTLTSSALNYFEVNGTYITDLSPIAGLTSLIFFGANETPAATGLPSLTNLVSTQLYLWDCPNLPCDELTALQEAGINVSWSTCTQ